MLADAGIHASLGVVPTPGFVRLRRGLWSCHARSVIPAARSNGWIGVWLLTAVVWSGALIGLGTWRNGALPPTETLASITAVTSGIALVLAVLGYFGARASFAGAALGLCLGLAYMAYVYATTTDGMADLAALLSFLMLGAAGLVVGIIVDVVAAVRRRQ